MNKENISVGGGYVTPSCVTLNVVLDAAVLAASFAIPVEDSDVVFE